MKDNARIIKGQQKEAELAKKKAESSSSSSSSESSEESSEEEDDKNTAAEPVEIIGKKKSQVAMHGATVVPVPAYLRNKQLLEKLKK